MAAASSRASRPWWGGREGGKGERGPESEGVEGVLRGGVASSRARGSSCVASRRWPRLGYARATRNASRREEDDARRGGLGWSVAVLGRTGRWAAARLVPFSLSLSFI